MAACNSFTMTDKDGDEITALVMGAGGDNPTIAITGDAILHFTPTEAAVFASALKELAERTY